MVFDINNAPVLKQYPDDFKQTGNIVADVHRFLALSGFHATAEHYSAVAAKANELAEKFGSDSSRAEQAGLLHDISVIIPENQRIEFARSHNVEIVPEEKKYPMIIHQKLSVVLAREVFKITDNGVLGAVECHTTLKSGATQLDKVVFLADKIAWDQVGEPPYMNRVTEAMEESLDLTVFEYLDYLWERRSQLQVIHPWFVEAHADLSLLLNR